MNSTTLSLKNKVVMTTRHAKARVTVTARQRSASRSTAAYATISGLRRGFFALAPVPFLPVCARISSEASAGLTISPTKSEASSAVETVCGRKNMKLPQMPGQKNIGLNAATVVKVDAMIGQATSLAPRFAAAFAGIPACTWR